MAETPLDVLVRSWRRSLVAHNRAARTIESYLDTVEQFAEWANVTDPAMVTRAQIEEWLG